MHWIDPRSLPVFEGTVERFTPNPKGRVDGFVLVDGTFVHVPPHLTDAVLALLRPGDGVRIQGVRPRGVADMVDAIALSAADGRMVVDEGPPDRDHLREHRGGAVRGPKPKHRASPDENTHKRDGASPPGGSPMLVSGVVRRALHSPKGELRGALLDDGTAIRLGPKEAERFADLLRRPGAPLAARGDGVVVPGVGRAVEAHEIGLDVAILQPVKPHKHPLPRHGSGSERHGPKHG